MSIGPLITAGELAVELSAGRPVTVLDATLVLRRPRHDGDFVAESGRGRWLDAHIPGSRHIAVDTDLSVPHPTQHDHHPEADVLASNLAAAGIGPDTSVVAYDTVGGLWAARVWYLLDWIGIDVRVLDGGIAAWRDAGLPTATGEDAPVATPRASWQVTTKREAWVDRAEIELLVGCGNLVCGLPEDAFQGTVPTRYSRRGHIPGSTNVPARALSGDDGRLLSPGEIRARYLEAGVDLDREVLLYCGGGISATANALALAHAGVRHVRVYDGSLEEWSADPALPLVVAASA
ncbi:sulfurtransferase [Agromyces endophyticus]|uniref:sulfurtransferase n=1 Tax=Agromyces sp. H17E-10 TaxID=2932244 RepID=UPI001FD161C4|nr:rhodanese-like domain-containing protein [Agromyces sp. H17E-10]UOQ89132.1 sulfurtransferase [Agromyces sp. H17E-10]